MEEMRNEEKFTKEGVEYSKIDIEKALEFLSTNTTKKYKSDNTGEEYSILYKNNRYAIKLIYEQMRIEKGLEYENKISATSIKSSFATYYEILPRIGNNDNTDSKKHVLENLKKEFKSYLNNLYPNGYDKTYEYDPFYLINDRSTDIKDYCKENNIYFWKIFENDDNLERYYQALKEKRPANTYNSYMSSTNRLKDFFNQKYGGYINWLKTLSVNDNPEINFELLEDWALNSLGKNHAAGDPDSGSKGPKVIKEFEKLGKALVSKFPNYVLSSCTSWQNSGKIYPYLWIQFKHKNWQDSPFSISMFVTKEKDKAKLCIETEIDDKNAKSDDYKNFLKTLNISSFYDNSWYWEDNKATKFQNIESALTSVAKGDSKKIKTIKLINPPYISAESNRIINELQASFEVLIPRYESIFESRLQQKENKMNIPLNQILYGPPGTGKTYSVRKYIDDLLGNNPGLKVEDEEQRINNVVKDLSWYTAIAISMYRNGKNNKYKVANLQYQKIIKAFVLTRENKNLRAALWAQMQIHTSPVSKTVNYTNRQEPYIFEKTEDSQWYLTEDGIKFVEENLTEQLELLSAKNSARKIEDFYKFITFHQSYSYEEFVEGIKPSINDESDVSTINYEYNKGIFKEICQQANSDPNNKYLLIIDEINRGNISKIFGELITLIESDKRVIPNGERTFENTQTKKEQLIVTLPYTKSKFGVPNNLYILGTMNTSDRSIASIDIALRRRFKFKEMMPDSKLVADFGCDFKNIFESLNKKIKVLLDRDHQIGQSYFINTKYANANISDLKEIWFSEIIPLLNEYFYCDWERLKLVIPGFIKEIDDIPEYLKNECDDIAYEFRILEDFTSDSDFETALNQEKY